MSSPVWFITGSSSGFGRTMCELALQKGHKVVATLRTPSDLDDLKSKYPPTHLVILRLDVTRPEEIAQAFRDAKSAVGQIDYVFNNAGYSIMGEVEGTPEDTARRLFDINFWGASNVNREAVRFFREENAPGVGGRLLVNSSFIGLVPMVSFGYYSASKAALDSVTQALASEIEPEWNIKITLIELGPFRTSMLQKGLEIDLHPAYSNPGSVVVKLREMVQASSSPDVPSGDVRKGAAKIFELTLVPNPPMRLLLGKYAVDGTRSQMRSILAEADAYEEWSEDLMQDTNSQVEV